MLVKKFWSAVKPNLTTTSVSNGKPKSGPTNLILILFEKPLYNSYFFGAQVYLYI